MPIFGVLCIYTCILLVAQTEMKVLTDENPYSVPVYLHFLAMSSKFDTFISKYFASKRGNLLIREKLSSLSKASSSVAIINVYHHDHCVIIDMSIKLV